MTVVAPSIPRYPSDWPTPQKEGHSGVIDAGIVRSPQVGFPQQRRFTPTAPTRMTLVFRMPVADVDTWLTWVNTYGITRWCLLPCVDQYQSIDPTPTYDWSIARFTGRMRQVPVGEYRVDVQCEVDLWPETFGVAKPGEPWPAPPDTFDPGLPGQPSLPEPEFVRTEVIWSSRDDYGQVDGILPNIRYNYRRLINIDNDTIIIAPRYGREFQYQLGVATASTGNWSTNVWAPGDNLPSYGGGTNLYTWSGFGWDGLSWQAFVWNIADRLCRTMNLGPDLLGSAVITPTHASYVRGVLFNNGVRALSLNASNGQKAFHDIGQNLPNGTNVSAINTNLNPGVIDWWTSGVHMNDAYYYVGIGVSGSTGYGLARVARDTGIVTDYSGAIEPMGSSILGPVFSDTDGTKAFIPDHSTISPTLTFDRIDTDLIPTRITQTFSENVRNGNIAYGGGRFVMYAVPEASQPYVLVKTSQDGLAWSSEQQIEIPVNTQTLTGDAANIFDEIKIGPDSKLYFSFVDAENNVVVCRAALP